MAEDHNEDEGGAADIGHGGDHAAAPKVKGKRLILILIIAILVLAGGGAALYFSGVFKHSAKDKHAEKTSEKSDAHGESKGEAKGESAHGDKAEEKHGEKAGAHGEKAEGKHGEEGEKKAEGEGGSGEVYQDLEEFLVNLDSQGKQPSFLKMTVTLVLPNAESATEVKTKLPRIRDSFQVYLRELRVDDLQGSAGLYRLREELLLRLNKIMYPVKMNDILFKSILVQ